MLFNKGEPLTKGCFVSSMLYMDRTFQVTVGTQAVCHMTTFSSGIW